MSRIPHQTHGAKKNEKFENGDFSYGNQEFFNLLVIQDLNVYISSVALVQTPLPDDSLNFLVSTNPSRTMMGFGGAAVILPALAEWRGRSEAA